jgi:hypothetical protein
VLSVLPDTRTLTLGYVVPTTWSSHKNNLKLSSSIFRLRGRRDFKVIQFFLYGRVTTISWLSCLRASLATSRRRERVHSMMSELQRMRRFSQMKQNGGKQIQPGIIPATNGIHVIYLSPLYNNYTCTQKVRVMDHGHVTATMTKAQVFLSLSRRIPGFSLKIGLPCLLSYHHHDHLLTLFNNGFGKQPQNQQGKGATFRILKVGAFFCCW